MTRYPTMRILLPAAGALILLLAGCGDDPTLAERDPHGYAACAAHARARTTTQSEVAMVAIVESGQEAQQAATAAIRDSAKDLAAGQAVADSDGLTKACEAEGFDIPAVKAKTS